LFGDLARFPLFAAENPSLFRLAPIALFVGGLVPPFCFNTSAFLVQAALVPCPNNPPARSLAKLLSIFFLVLPICVLAFLSSFPQKRFINFVLVVPPIWRLCTGLVLSTAVLPSLPLSCFSSFLFSFFFLPYPNSGSQPPAGFLPPVDPTNSFPPREGPFLAVDVFGTVDCVPISKQIPILFWFAFGFFVTTPRFLLVSFWDPSPPSTYLCLLGCSVGLFPPRFFQSLYFPFFSPLWIVSVFLLSLFIDSFVYIVRNFPLCEDFNCNNIVWTQLTSCK